MKTLLIDIDSTIPNLALMHISTWKKGMGNDVGFNIDDPDEVYASCVFKDNRHLADGLRFYYPNAMIDIGGSGIDLKKHLPEEVDRMVKLKPCPFCGSDAVLDEYIGREYHCYYVKCSKCPISTQIYYSENKAIKIWNRRVNE